MNFINRAYPPSLGPRFLFFSGGTALRALSHELIHYTHNSIHIITPFDSGGSSAELRKAFNMPAVGDIRNRLLALADFDVKGNPAVYHLFAHRLAKDAAKNKLQDELTRMAAGRHPLVKQIPEPDRGVILSHVRSFLERMPEKFNLKGASIGNLFLAAGYLESQRQFDPAIDLFSNLVCTRGVVRPVVNKDCHLVAELDSGQSVVGQHRLTGKETSPIASRVKRVYLSEQSRQPGPADVEIRSKMRGLIQLADLICYPMGSFYSSLIANLLPKGVGHAISEINCPKIYIPNTSIDPESYGLDPMKQTEILLSYLRTDCTERIRNQALLNLVLVDKKRGRYAVSIDESRFRKMGIDIIDYPLISKESDPYIDATRLSEFLLSLVQA